MLSRIEVLIMAYANIILANIGDKSIVAEISGIVFGSIYILMLFMEREYVRKRAKD